MASDLTVNVEGIAQSQGSIMLGLFDEATYDGDGAVNGANLKVEGAASPSLLKAWSPANMPCVFIMTSMMMAK